MNKEAPKSSFWVSLGAVEHLSIHFCYVITFFKPKKVEIIHLLSRSKHGLWVHSLFNNRMPNNALERKMSVMKTLQKCWGTFRFPEVSRVLHMWLIAVVWLVLTGSCFFWVFLFCFFLWEESVSVISLSGLTLEVSGCLSLSPQPGAAGFTHIKLLSVF